MITIFLPAYNEERDIQTLLERIREAMEGQDLMPYRVLVINDGSTDNTLAVLRGCQNWLPLEVLDHGVNKGLGQAMLTGLRRAAELLQDGDILVTMDADNTHDPALIGVMVQKVQAGADVVIASRYEKGGEEVGLSGLRSMLSRGASSLLKIFFPIRGGKDYTCGFRAYRAKAIHQAFLIYEDRFVEERGFTCMAEILIKLRAIGAHVDEVPLILRYDLKTGQSKMKVFRTIMRYFVLISRNLFLPQRNAL